MKHTESQHQRALVAWAALATHRWVPGHIGDYLIAIPNGGARRKVEAAILKAEGVKAGVSDLFLAVPASHKHGLWIEMKADAGIVSTPQGQWIALMRQAGYMAEVCWDWEDARSLILYYLEGTA